MLLSMKGGEIGEFLFNIRDIVFVPTSGAGVGEFCRCLPFLSCLYREEQVGKFQDV